MLVGRGSIGWADAGYLMCLSIRRPSSKEGLVHLGGRVKGNEYTRMLERHRPKFATMIRT